MGKKRAKESRGVPSSACVRVCDRVCVMSSRREPCLWRHWLPGAALICCRHRHSRLSLIICITT